MAKLRIGNITTEIKLPEIVTEEIPESAKTSEEIETAILCQNELRETVEKIEKNILAHGQSLDKLMNKVDDSIKDIEKLKDIKVEISEPNVEVKTIVIDKSKEIKKDLELMEDSIRLSVNGLFSNLDNKIDKKVKDLNKINKTLWVCLIIVTIIAILK